MRESFLAIEIAARMGAGAYGSPAAWWDALDPGEQAALIAWVRLVKMEETARAMKMAGVGMGGRA
mgnify:CR=1 FL=1